MLVACCLVAIIWGDVARNLCKIRCWWYTFMGDPLGRVFKIHDNFLYGFDKKMIS